MRPYGTVSPLFWTGRTGKALRTDRDAQVVALYLMTNPHSHQTGMYYLPLMYMAHESGLTIEGARKALTRLSEDSFCEYDEASEWVWVREMAAWQIGTALSVNDKRCKGVQQYLESMPNLPFVQRFVARYRVDFHLTDSTSPIQAPSEGHSSNRTGAEQEQEGSTRETARGARATRQTGKSAGPEEPPPPGLDLVAWKRFADYRVATRKPIKPASLLAAQRKLAGFGANQAAVVEQTIANGWQGLFALKDGLKPKEEPRRGLPILNG